MEDILDIYKKYKIMPNLALHQLRVASVCDLIAQNLSIDVDHEKLITAALLHDMGNIIKFDLKSFPEFNEPLGLEYWQRIQNEYFEKYGKDEHDATKKILQEIKIKDDVIDTVSNMVFGLLCINKDGDNLELKILHYADMRVGPYGVLSYEARMEDAKERYAKKLDNEFTREKNRHTLLSCGKDIEDYIFENSKIHKEDITDESISRIIEKLKSYKIKVSQ